MEQDAASEQAYASLSSRQKDYGGDGSVSFFDGSSLESATNIDLDASSVGTYASYDASVASQWLPPVSSSLGGAARGARDSPMTAHGSFMSSVSFAGNLQIRSLSSSDAGLGSKAQHAQQEQDDIIILPEDMSVSTDQPPFPSLQSLPSLRPPSKSPSGRGGSWSSPSLGGRGVSGSQSVVTASSKGHAAKYFHSPYHIRGREPPRPFSPPSLVVPDTAGRNWSREDSAYDRMLEQERRDKAGLTVRKALSVQPTASEARDSQSSMRSESRSPQKPPHLFDPLASASPSAASPTQHARSPALERVSKPGPPRLYKCEVVSPFTENERCPMVLQYCRLSTFNSTAAYLDQESMPSLDEDSDEEAWAEMEGVSRATAAPESRGVAMAPLCWEAVFRRETQEEILADIL